MLRKLRNGLGGFLLLVIFCFWLDSYHSGRTVRALEGRHPEMTDLHFEGTERRRITSDGSEVLGKSTPIHVLQIYDPARETRTADLLSQALTIAESHGWDLAESSNGNSWNGTYGRQCAVDPRWRSCETETDTMIIRAGPRNVSVRVVAHPEQGWDRR